ncbi:very short patch repair endonuclease [Microbacterium sp. NPDC019599]|uniref:very short patch repair endonuclease n=1 Tax=Microbacterium sp. NPDC019599 TaxID=3154690 RepID=UPI003401F532
MVDSWASSENVRRAMLGNRRRDTTPELRVRRLVHAAGLRYRVDVRPVSTVPTRADIVFSKRRIAIFIDGCFWHSCPEHGVAPKTNVAYWRPKLERNRTRDRTVTTALQSHGWMVLRFWEHEDPGAVARAIGEAYWKAAQ